MALCFILKLNVTLFYSVLFVFICFITRSHSSSVFVTRCHLLSLVVTSCHSLSLVVPLVITRCHSLYHSLSFVVTRCTTRCHSLSLDVPLACLFTNDLLQLHLLKNRFSFLVKWRMVASIILIE